MPAVLWRPRRAAAMMGKRADSAARTRAAQGASDRMNDKTAFIYRISYRMRIWLAFVSIICVAIASVGVASYQLAARVAERNATELNQETVNKAAQALESKLGHVRITALSLSLNPTYRQSLGLEITSEDRGYYTNMSLLQSAFTQLKLIEPMIDSILVSTPQGDYYMMTQKRVPDYPFVGSPMYERMMNATGFHREMWFAQHEDPFFDSKQQVISFLTEGVMNDLSKNVFLLVNVQASKLAEFVASNLDRSQGQYILLSSQGEQIVRISSDFDIQAQGNAPFREALAGDAGHFEYTTGNQSYMVNYKKMPTLGGYVLFSVLNRSELLRQLNGIKWFISLTLLCCMLASFLFAGLLTRWLLGPLNRLRKLMKDVGRNNLHLRYESKYQDEISQLGGQFNGMLDEIRLLFREVSTAEQEKRRAEVKALQAQINPHFLYNTLNTIYWKSQLGQLADVQLMVLALSSMFQLGLNRGEELTTVGNELLHVEQYLKIQQLCYKHLFDYTIQAQEGVDAEWRVLKTIIQPLAENSILHGFRDRNTGGFISIRVFCEQGMLLFVVEDNGVGMPSEVESRSDRKPLGGYALSNIRQRLELQYGAAGKLELEGVPGAYTRVTVTVPVIAAAGEGNVLEGGIEA